MEAKRITRVQSGRSAEAGGNISGLRDGRLEGWRESLATLLEARCGAKAAGLVRQLESVADPEVLRRALRVAASGADLAAIDVSLGGAGA